MKIIIGLFFVLLLNGCTVANFKDVEHLMTNAEKMRILYEPLDYDIDQDYIYYEEWDCLSEMIVCPEFIR